MGCAPSSLDVEPAGAVASRGSGRSSSDAASAAPTSPAARPTAARPTAARPTAACSDFEAADAQERELGAAHRDLAPTLTNPGAKEQRKTERRFFISDCKCNCILYWFSRINALRRKFTQVPENRRFFISSADG